MKSLVLTLIFVIVAIAIAVHQYIYYGIFFDPLDLHHETWIIMFIFAGFILWIRGGKD